MPTQLFYTTQIPVSLWFINKQKKQPGKTLFIDARKMGTMVSRKLRELTEGDIKKIVDTYEAFVDGTLEDVNGSVPLPICRKLKSKTLSLLRADM